MSDPTTTFGKLFRPRRMVEKLGTCFSFINNCVYNVVLNTINKSDSDYIMSIL